MATIALLFLILAIGCHSISQLAQHGKLRWMTGKNPYGFWGAHSDKRKYKFDDMGNESPAFFLSTTLLVFLTDGYHMCQALFLLFISLSIGMALEFNWWLIAVVWLLVHLVHFGVYRLLQK